MKNIEFMLIEIINNLITYFIKKYILAQTAFPATQSKKFYRCQDGSKNNGYICFYDLILLPDAKSGEKILKTYCYIAYVFLLKNLANKIYFLVNFSY